MAAVMSPGRMTLISQSHWNRVGLIPMVIALSFGWIFVLLWLGVAVYVFPFNPLWTMVLSASTALFAFYLGVVSHRLISDAFSQYTFELTDSEAVLSVNDRLHKRHSTQMVLLSDVKYAEYYPFQDSASIILHAPYCDMEVPLWPLGSHSQDVVDFLDGRGVPVVNVQSDDKIPD